MSKSQRHHGLQPTRLLHPRDFPGKSTGVGCHCLLHCMKVKSESKVLQSCPTLCDSMDCSLPGSSVHGIFQARVLATEQQQIFMDCKIHPFFFLAFIISFIFYLLFPSSLPSFIQQTLKQWYVKNTLEKIYYDAIVENLWCENEGLSLPRICTRQFPSRKI